MNVTRSSPSYSYPGDGDPFDASQGSLLSSNPLPSSSSLSSGTLDPTAIHASEATPEIERWLTSVSNRGDDTGSRYARSIDGPASETPSRATSRLSSNTDNHSARQGIYAVNSSSSLSLASHTLSSPLHPNRRTRDLPPVPHSQGYSYNRGPSSTSSQTSYMPQRRASQDEPPPLPPLPTSSHASPQDQRPPISPISLPSRRATSPTSSIHSRSLPVPPPLSATKPPVPPLPIMPSRSTPASPDPGPTSSTLPHPPPLRSRSHTHLRSLSAFPESQRNYNSPVKLPPTYTSSERDDIVLPAPAQGPNRSLTIRTTNISQESAVLSARSASIRDAPSRPTSRDGDSLDLPPAYSVLDMARSPLQLRREVNADGE